MTEHDARPSLLAHVIHAIDNARSLQRSDFARRSDTFPTSLPQAPVFPQTGTPGHPCYLSSLTRSSTRARPQSCDCGANKLIAVACHERCSARL